MDHARIYKLLDKFWECRTSVEEERELRCFFSSAFVPPDLLPYKSWFISSEAEKLPPLDNSFDEQILQSIRQEKKWRRFSLISASIIISLLLLLILIGIIYFEKVLF